MATLFDIAQITGFSQATVQRVLEGRDSIGQEARNRIFLAAKLTGFKYGKAENDGGAKEANSKLIGVIA
ncbi:MAG: LacI family DNA-binding transcriptional regulator, partial [Treponema sp.]|nr:LacI family DNA-binding transcriptional regulator [Treponema sp.]